MASTVSAPWAIDSALINPRAVRLVKAFKDALVRMRDEHGFTFEDLSAAATLLQRLHDATGAPLAMFAIPVFSETFQSGGHGYTISEDIDSPTYIPGAPMIENPGTLPMRADEPGIPLLASGRVLDGNRRPLAGAELVVYHAANNGSYSGIGHDGQPEFNLRARQLTDAEGRYAFTTITPMPYSDPPPSEVADAVTAALAALGRSHYRPAHIHYEIHHPDLISPFRGEIYFAGDPVIPIDVVGPYFAAPSLQADTVRHEDPEDIAAHGFRGPFNTAVYDFILKTHTSPEVAREEPLHG